MNEDVVVSEAVDRMAKAGCFVIIAVGAVHAARLPLAVKSLQKFSSAQIYTLVARAELPKLSAPGRYVEVPAAFTDAQASRWLKTSIHRLLPNSLRSDDQVLCYLDTDIVAVSPAVDQIFAEFTPPVTFATDHLATVSNFSKAALVHGQPGELTGILHDLFQVEVDPHWSLWNGGAFLFSKISTEFLKRWHDLVLLAFQDARFTVRDQPALIATAWMLGLQNQRRFPSSFNWLVRHTPEWRSQLTFSEDRFSFEGEVIHFLHFINGFGSRYGDESCWEWGAAQKLIEGTTGQRA